MLKRNTPQIKRPATLLFAAFFGYGSMAGHLFAAFLTTAEAQKTWEEFVGHTSAFIPGTRANAYVKGKQVLYMTQKQSEMVERLTRDYTKILGMK